MDLCLALNSIFEHIRLPRRPVIRRSRLAGGFVGDHLRVLQVKFYRSGAAAESGLSLLQGSENLNRGFFLAAAKALKVGITRPGKAPAGRGAQGCDSILGGTSN
jgi:hypothetical protein